MEKPTWRMDFSTQTLQVFRWCATMVPVMIMFDSMDGLKLVSVYEGDSSIHRTFLNKPYHVLVYKHSGVSAYQFSDRRVVLSEGEILYIPKGSSYSVTLLSQGESRYITIFFDAELPALPATLLSLPEILDPTLFFRTMLRRWLFGVDPGHFLCYAMFYELLAHLREPESRNTQQDLQRRRIALGIAYLEQHIFDLDLNIPAIAACAGISENYFRRLFQSVYGQSPKQYIQTKRLNQAKALLESGDLTTVQDAAAQVGYEDPLYFSRIFRKAFGTPPSALLGPG